MSSLAYSPLRKYSTCGASEIIKKKKERKKRIKKKTFIGCAYKNMKVRRLSPFFYSTVPALFDLN